MTLPNGLLIGDGGERDKSKAISCFIVRTNEKLLVALLNAISIRPAY